MSLLSRTDRSVCHIFLRRYAQVVHDGRGACNEHFDSRFVLNLENSKSEQRISRSTFTNYEFPKLSLKYSSEDVAHHRASLMEEWHPAADERTSKKVQVPLPSFPLVFSNCIMIALANRKFMLKDRTVHLEQYVDMIRPLKPEGIITYELKVADVIDKERATIFIYDLHGRDEDENDLFFLQKKFFEINLDAVDQTRSEERSPKKTVEEEPMEKQPDHTFEFKTTPFNHARLLNPTSDDLKESTFSPNHWRQFHDIAPNFSPEPICHGRYSLGAVTNQILNHFANGDGASLKRIQTRFTHAVYAADILVTKAWQIDEKIIFETYAKDTGKRVLQGHLDLKRSE